MFRLRWPYRAISIEDLAIPAVSSLIIFLAYTSQYLFYYLAPGPLTKTEAIWFNILVLGIWWCYDRACTVDPGQKGWVEKANRIAEDSEDEESEVVKLEKGMRWCKKCDAIKPPRAHHCRQCGRYLPSLVPPSSTIAIFKRTLVDNVRGKAASQKWITIAPGPPTASRTPPSRISSASSSTLSSPCPS
jgi:ribosomal protein L40E